MKLSNNVIAALATWVYLRKRRKRRKIRSYVRAINLRRMLDGEFQKLVMPMRTLYPEEHFAYFRMTPARFDDLLRRVEPYLHHPPTHLMPITPMHRLAITLRYLAAGGPLSSLIYSYRLGQSTLSKIVRETTLAIWKALKDEFLRPPTRDEWKEIAANFWNQWNFALCLGAIDGKHIPIKVSPDQFSFFQLA